MIGDFNEILTTSEKVDGPLRSERQMRGFREALGYCDLIDLGFTGSMTTWWSSQTQLRLDRAVATTSWIDIFEFSKLVHLPPSDSDHVPILLQASSVPIPKRPKHHRFKFESFWLQHKDCDPLVLAQWSNDFEGLPMYNLTRKIASTRVALDKWHNENFRARQHQMMHVRLRLEALLDIPTHLSSQQEKTDLMAQLQSLLSQEEAFWNQRSKVMWLKEGDRNTSFFHRKASNRKRKNTIHGLFDSQGQWFEDDIRLEHVVTSYFTHMFSASDVDTEAMEATLQAIQPCVTADMNHMLCAEYSEEEVRTALF